MLGYVVPEKPELKIREYELYSGYYCGLCKSVEKRYGQLPRLALNYDSVFLALVLSSFEKEEEQFQVERCPVHPLKKRLIVRGQRGIDYAADLMVLLAYYKSLDDRRDDQSFKAAAANLMLSRSYEKVMKFHDEKGIMIKDCLDQLQEIETERVPSLDQAAEPFSKMMEVIFQWKDMTHHLKITQGLGRMGYHIGKWIYLIDAVDDLDRDQKSGNYNPLLAQYGSPPKMGEREDWWNKIEKSTQRNLLLYLSELAKAWEEIRQDKNRGLIENIIYLGLLRKTEDVLTKGKTTHAESV